MDLARGPLHLMRMMLSSVNVAHAHAMECVAAPLVALESCAAVTPMDNYPRRKRSRARHAHHVQDVCLLAHVQCCRPAQSQQLIVQWACRWEAGARAVHLADMPHRVLTRAARVFEYDFEGAQKARGRENILRLEVRGGAGAPPHTSTPCISCILAHPYPLLSCAIHSSRRVCHAPGHFMTHPQSHATRQPAMQVRGCSREDRALQSRLVW